MRYPPETKEYFSCIAEYSMNQYARYDSSLLFQCFLMKHTDLYSDLGAFIKSSRKVINDNHSQTISIDLKHDPSGKRKYYFIVDLRHPNYKIPMPFNPISDMFDPRVNIKLRVYLNSQMSPISNVHLRPLHNAVAPVESTTQAGQTVKKEIGDD